MDRPDLDDARDKAHEVGDSTAYQWLVRGGLVAFGVVHLLVAYLAARLAFGATSEDASQTGALRELAGAPLGPFLLWGTSLGLFVISLWQLLSAFVGHLHLSGTVRTRRRAASVGRAAVYGALGWNAASIATGGSGGDGGDTASATLLSLPFGQILVGLVGVVIGIVGVSQIMKGVRDKYEEELKGSLSAAQKWVARVGHVGKGAAIMIVAALFVWAAWTYDATSAGGLDTALQTVRTAPFGPVILLAIAAGFACYGLYCFIWARHARFH
ncbi:DUF1206 domain-containing protein [Tessaracoccus antarcticus]|nr:DUF1206 domain-containing protein [Tessaracoccus antarcticus]